MYFIKPHVLTRRIQYYTFPLHFLLTGQNIVKTHLCGVATAAAPELTSSTATSCFDMGIMKNWLRKSRTMVMNSEGNKYLKHGYTWSGYPIFWYFLVFFGIFGFNYLRKSRTMVMMARSSRSPRCIIIGIVVATLFIQPNTVCEFLKRSVTALLTVQIPWG